MGLRVSVIVACALLACSSALAGVPLVRTLATAQGFGSVIAGVSTNSLRTRLWVQRIGGVGIAHGSADTTCGQLSNGSSQMFTLTLTPNARANLWLRGGSGSCVVTVKLRGKGRITIAFRGY
jgi:hypothetical protein